MLGGITATFPRNVTKRTTKNNTAFRTNKGDQKLIDITKLHIHWRDHEGKTHIKMITPTNATNTLEIKKDIAEYVSTIKAKAEYYYVVIEIDRGGKAAYRTIIPKTMLSA